MTAGIPAADGTSSRSPPTASWASTVVDSRSGSGENPVTV
jgi:hypothetical protein